MSSEQLYIPVCTNCGKEIGMLDDGELNALLPEGFADVLCFDCDPESAATTPSVFWQWQENDLFDIGDLGFQIRDNQLRVIGRAHERTHERTRARGLSSYTYLNSTLKNWQVLPNGRIVGPCPQCGNLGDLFASDGDLFCPRCKQVSGDERYIVLPAFLLGKGVASD